MQRRQISVLVLLLCLVLCLSQEAAQLVREETADGTSTTSQPGGPADFELSDEVPVGAVGSVPPINEKIPDSETVESSIAEEEVAASGETTTLPLATEANVTTNETGEVADVDTGIPIDATSAANASTTNTSSTTSEASEEETAAQSATKVEAPPVQAGPFIDLLGPQLLSLEMIDASHAQLVPHYTNEVLKDKKVVGLYFSADWCGPCRKFTPELVAFYNKMNERRGKTGDFEIVWVSRCRDVNSYGQYFAQMGKWLALPPEEAMGERGRLLGDMYKVKGIPSLVLLDDLGNVITRDARNKIPADKAGIGFPWRNPIANIYVTLVPRSVRLMMKSQVVMIKDKMFQRLKRILGLQRRA